MENKAEWHSHTAWMFSRAAICFTPAHFPVGLFIKSHPQDTVWACASFNDCWKSAEEPYKQFGMQHKRKFSRGNFWHTMSPDSIVGPYAHPKGDMQNKICSLLEKKISALKILILCFAVNKNWNGREAACRAGCCLPSLPHGSSAMQTGGGAGRALPPALQWCVVLPKVTPVKMENYLNNTTRINAYILDVYVWYSWRRTA